MTRLVILTTVALLLWSGVGVEITGWSEVETVAADPFPPDRAFAPGTPYPSPPHEIPAPAYELPIEFGGPEAPEAEEVRPQHPAKAEKEEKSAKQEQIDKIERRTGHKVKSWQVLER